MKTLKAIGELLALWIAILAVLAATAWFLAPVDAAVHPQMIFRTTT